MTPASVTAPAKILMQSWLARMSSSSPLAAVGLGIALEMAEEADHLAFEQRRAAAFARPLDDLARRFVDGEEIGAIDGDARQAEARGAVDDSNPPPWPSRREVDSA